MATFGLRQTAEVLAIVSSGLFAGYTYSLSDAALTGVLEAPESVLLCQWRYQFIRGFYVAIPSTIINILSFGYLAYSTPSSLARQLFITAAVTTGSGTVFAWTLLRAVNGALAVRAEKVLGVYAPNPEIAALTYAATEERSKALEKGAGSRLLVEKWIALNRLRAWVMMAGVVAGAVALAIGKSA